MPAVAHPFFRSLVDFVSFAVRIGDVYAAKYRAGGRPRPVARPCEHLRMFARGLIYAALPWLRRIRFDNRSQVRMNASPAATRVSPPPI
jgi:hypothetical protein